MSIGHHSRVRLRHRRLVRREPCRWGPPRADLLDRLYTVLREPDDTWALFAGTTRLVSARGPGATHTLATAMLADALPGHELRPDLIEAFAGELPEDAGFVLPTDLVSAWALGWALNHPL
jgi:hypothetical protein